MASTVKVIPHRDLLSAFMQSSTVQTGSRGGFPVLIDGETWHVGRSPSGHFQVTNGVAGEEVRQFCRYTLTISGILTRNTTGRFQPFLRTYWVNKNADLPVTSEAEEAWLMALLKAVEGAPRGRSLALGRPPI